MKGGSNNLCHIEVMKNVPCLRLPSPSSCYHPPSSTLPSFPTSHMAILFTEMLVVIIFIQKNTLGWQKIEKYAEREKPQDLSFPRVFFPQHPHRDS